MGKVDDVFVLSVSSREQFQFLRDALVLVPRFSSCSRILSYFVFHCPIVDFVRSLFLQLSSCSEITSKSPAILTSTP